MSLQFDFTDDDEAFRAELRALLHQVFLPGSWRACRGTTPGS